MGTQVALQNPLYSIYLAMQCSNYQDGSYSERNPLRELVSELILKGIAAKYKIRIYTFCTLTLYVCATMWDIVTHVCLVTLLYNSLFLFNTFKWVRYVYLIL